MHAGETKEVNHLIARKSSLGWVVFRGKTKETPDASAILHVKHTSPIDLTDFWTTESMGVAVKSCFCDPENLTQIEGD